MLTPAYTNRFEKDLRQMIRRGNDVEKIKAVVKKILEEKPLDRKHSDHLLTGNFKDCRECHIEPDWLLIYRIDETRVIFERTGNHADLFR